jgi:hypothetical protein
MRRILTVPILGMWVAACGAGGGAPPAAPVPGPAASPPAPAFQPGVLPPGPTTPRAQLRVEFGGLVDTIEVGAVDRLPLRAAVLVAPDGTTAPASYINVTDNPRVATGQWSLSHRWEDPVGPVNTLGVPAMPALQADAALHARQQLLAMRSVAEIPLSDPVAYRRDWRNWRIRLTFGTPPGDVVTTEIPAPEPPPR